MTLPSAAGLPPNPFATSRTRPAAAPFAPTGQASVAGVLLALEGTGLRGQILGPHGAGKSTLWERVAECLVSRGYAVHVVRLRGAAPAPDGGLPHRDPSAVVMIDGFERLPRWRRWWFATIRCRGLIVTSHRSVGLPTVARLAPMLAEARVAFRAVVGPHPTPVTEEDLAKAFHRCGGNLRETWFDLYDLHERRVREVCRGASADGPCPVLAGPERPGPGDR